MAKYKILGIILLLAGLGFFLSRVFGGQIILSQYFHLGPLIIHYYGLIMAVAAVAGFYLAIKRSVLYNLDRKTAEDVLFWVIIGGFVGARLYHVLSSATYYWQNPVDIFKVWHGGLSIYGAVLGGIVAVWLYKKISNFQFPISNLLDWLVPAVALGQIIGRFGNLFNYEAFGYPTNLPWKMFVKKSFRPALYQNENFFHPWFFYEILGNLIILFLLLKVIPTKIKKSPQGFIVFFYLLLYNSLRFALEFLRIDSTFVGIFRLNAVVSLILVLVSAAALLVIGKKNKNNKSLYYGKTS